MAVSVEEIEAGRSAATMGFEVGKAHGWNSTNGGYPLALDRRSFFNYKYVMAGRSDDSVEVISFRIDREVLDQIDRLANMERRTRAGMIRVMLENSINAVKIVKRHLEWLVKTLNEEEKRDPNSIQAEYFRGELNATKWLLGLFCGERVKGRVLEEIRQETGLPIPHIVPLAPDGQRYGFDSDAG